MTTVLDLQALQAAAGIQVTLADGVLVRSASVTSEAVQGFSDVRAVELVVRVPVLRGHPTPSVTVTVQQSTNGSDWTTGHAFTFTATGEGSFTLDAPDDYLRVVCAPAGGLREAVVSVVASIVTVDAPEGGGSQAGAVRVERCDPFTAADVAAGAVVLFTPAAGEYVVGGGVVDFEPPNTINPFFCVGPATDTTVDRNALAQVSTTIASGNDLFGGQLLNYPFQSVPVSDPIYGGVGLNFNPSLPWAAANGYGISACIVAAGHCWTNSGAAGVSGGSAPDFAAHLSGSVADGGDIVWNDAGVVPVSGSMTVWLLVASGLA